MPAWRKFLAQLADSLVILLLVATAISTGLWVYERDSALPHEALAIFAVVLLNAVMGYIQQSRAEHAVAALRSMSAAHANVVRDGVRRARLGGEPNQAAVIDAEGLLPPTAGGERQHKKQRETCTHDRTPSIACVRWDAAFTSCDARATGRAARGTGAR